MTLIHLRKGKGHVVMIQLQPTINICPESQRFSGRFSAENLLATLSVSGQ